MVLTYWLGANVAAFHFIEDSGRPRLAGRAAPLTERRLSVVAAALLKMNVA